MALDDESEVALDRLKGRKLERGFGAGRLRFGVRYAFQNDLEGDQRAFGIERFKRARMQLAEIAEHVLRTDLDRAGAAGMKPGGSAGHHLQSRRRGTGSGE